MKLDPRVATHASFVLVCSRVFQGTKGKKSGAIREKRYGYNTQIPPPDISFPYRVLLEVDFYFKSTTYRAEAKTSDSVGRANRTKPRLTQEAPYLFY